MSGETDETACAQQKFSMGENDEEDLRGGGYILERMIVE